MKTLDYLNLDNKNVENVVVALQNLLADFQVYYTNLRGFHWEIKGRGFFVLHEKFESMYDDGPASPVPEPHIHSQSPAPSAHAVPEDYRFREAGCTQS